VLATVRRDNIEAKGGTWPAEEEAKFKAPIEAQYETQGHPTYASARLWDDGVIAPEDTRMTLALCLSAARNNPVAGWGDPAAAAGGEARFGVFRM
jgi:3-methylcrotonyl-CoA carboxylase beta subunit